MKVALRLTLALIATFGASGCRTAGVAPSARPTPPPEPKITFRLDEFVEEHNQNAKLIETVDARPSIQVTMTPPDGGEPQSGRVNGRLAVLQPQNFKLELASVTSNMADIGSNEKQFWFWVQSKVDKHVYYCDYADLPTSDLAPTYQPDWIVNALGLKPITADEAAAVRISRGTAPNTTLLTFPPSRTAGSAYPREMVVSDVSNRMTEYRVLDRDGKTVLGHATIKSYSNNTLKPKVAAEADTDDKTEPVVETTCYLPDHIVLDWKREKLTLDISLKSLKLNQPISEEKRTAIFVQPKLSGYPSLDLAEATRNGPRGGIAGGEVSVRETLPAPEPRNRVKLGAPVEIQGGELDTTHDAMPASTKPREPAKRNQPKPVTPPATDEPMLLPVFEDVVGAAPPRTPQSPFQHTASAADVSTSLTLDR